LSAVDTVEHVSTIAAPQSKYKLLDLIEFIDLAGLNGACFE
jgi:hypothetical protein